MKRRLTLRRADLERILNQSLWKDVEIKEHIVDGHSVVDVHLTDDMLITALTLGTRIHQKAKALDLIHIIQGGVREDIIGLEGALAAAAYLYENWLEGLDSVTIGKGDDGDIKFKGAVVDVKTRSQRWHDTLMIPEKQWGKHHDKYDYYVGCHEIEEEWIRIWGYATKEEVASIKPSDELTDSSGKTFNLPVTSRCIPFENLHPIKELKIAEH